MRKQLLIFLVGFWVCFATATAEAQVIYEVQFGFLYGYTHSAVPPNVIDETTR